MFFKVWTERHGRNLLTYTSFLFGLTSIRAMSVGHWMGPIFLIQMGLSILHHGKYHDEYCGKKLVKWIDKGLAYEIALRTLYDAIQQPLETYIPWMSLYWVSASWVVYIHWIGQQNDDSAIGCVWHATVHGVSNIGSIALLEASLKNDLYYLKWK